MHTDPQKILLIGKVGKRIGMGHLVRLSSLYDILRPVYETTLLINDDKAGLEFANRGGIRFNYYKSYTDIIKFIKKIGNPAVIIVDILYFPLKDLRVLKNYCKFLIVFDDLHKLVDKQIEGVIICPQETFKNKIEYKKYTCIVKGADFFPLKNTYRLYRKRKIFSNSVKHILISLGGFPAREDILFLIGNLDDCLDKKIFIHAVLGYSLFGLNKLFSKRIVIHTKLEDLGALITKADLGIISAGFVKFEFMCIGTPFCIVSINSHQKELAKKFSSKGYGIYLGYAKALRAKPKNFCKKINYLLYANLLRKEMFLRSRKLIDGNGDVRLLKFISDLLERERM